MSPINLLKPTGHVMHHQFNIQQLYALPTLYLCVLYLSENKLKNKKPTRHLLFYCTSYRLNMFRALLCPSSGAHDYNVDYHIGRIIFGLL